MNATDEIMQLLDGLYFPEETRECLADVVARVRLFQARRERGLPVPDTDHIECRMVISGKPGMGKSLLARKMGAIYKALGLLPKGQVIEVECGDLVGDHADQTCEKTRAAIERARGGVLVIDRADELFFNSHDGEGESSFCMLHEAVALHGELAFVLLIDQERLQTLLWEKPSILSRIGSVIEIPPYTPEDMLGVSLSICKKNKLFIAPEAERRVCEYFTALSERGEEGVMNGRTAELFAKDLAAALVVRLLESGSFLEHTAEERSTVTPEDVRRVIEQRT